jgi:hypothetical protein
MELAAATQTVAAAATEAEYTTGDSADGWAADGWAAVPSAHHFAFELVTELRRSPLTNLRARSILRIVLVLSCPASPEKTAYASLRIRVHVMLDLQIIQQARRRIRIGI